jgi:hypothetical protein
MRGLNLMFGAPAPRRNDPIELVDLHPIEQYADDTDTGNAGRDGFSVLSRAWPDRQGDPPFVAGTVGPVYRGPAEDFER